MHFDNLIGGLVTEMYLIEIFAATTRKMSLIDIFHGFTSFIGILHFDNQIGALVTEMLLFTNCWQQQRRNLLIEL